VFLFVGDRAFEQAARGEVTHLGTVGDRPRQVPEQMLRVGMSIET
jgi:hypothetical protein